MRKPTDGQLAIGALIAFALWIFVALPLYYGQSDNTAANNCSAQENQNYSFWEKARCDPVAYFTLWLVGFTGILGPSTIGLWWVTWQGAKRQSRDMDASIRVATKTAENAEKALLSLEIPHVYPVEMKFDVGRDPHGAPLIATISFSLKNFGRSPAFLNQAYIIVSVSQPMRAVGQRPLYHSGPIPFMADDVIGDKEVFGPLSKDVSELIPYCNQIRDGALHLNLLVNHRVDDALGHTRGRGAWHVWNPKRQKFVAGVQPWTEN